MTTVSDGRQINVLDPQFYVDPWEAYRWLQDQAPVFRDPVQQLWAISRYDDVRSVEKDGERFSSFHGSRPHIDQRSDESMINMDDPAHQAQRSLVLRRFTPRAIRGHEERCETSSRRSSTMSRRMESARPSRWSPRGCRQ